MRVRARRDRPQGRAPGARDLVVLGVLGTAYSVFAFVGLGHEPFLWSLVLAAAGLPVYWLLRAPPRRRCCDDAAAEGRDA